MLGRHRGFTLIELMVVIAIIGLLSSIALASLASARTKAINSVERTTVQTYLDALNRYYIDHDEYPGYINCLGQGYPGGQCSFVSGPPLNESAALNAALQPYYSGLPRGNIDGYVYSSGDGQTLAIFWQLKGNVNCASFAHTMTFFYNGSTNLTTCETFGSPTFF